MGENDLNALHIGI